MIRMPEFVLQHYPDQFLTREQAAERLNRSVATLRKWACNHYGPPFERPRNHRVRYRLSDVEAWERLQTDLGDPVYVAELPPNASDDP